MPDSEDEQIESNMMTEYVVLREQIMMLAQARQTLSLFNIAAAGTVLTFALSEPSRWPVAFILPLLCYLLGVRYFGLGYHLYQTGAYIRSEIHSKVSGGLSWERWINDNRNSGVSKNPALSSLLFGPSVFLIPAGAGWSLAMASILVVGSFDTAERVALSGISVVSFGFILLIYASWRHHRSAVDALGDP